MAAKSLAKQEENGAPGMNGRMSEAATGHMSGQASHRGCPCIKSSYTGIFIYEYE